MSPTQRGLACDRIVLSGRADEAVEVDVRRRRHRLFSPRIRPASHPQARENGADDSTLFRVLA
jgi:hypothetical protein